MNLVFFATAWGREHGGENVLNLELVRALIALHKPNSHFEVFCCVESAQLPTEPWCIVSDADLEPKLTELARTETWWIGHDLHTGPSAAAARAKHGGRLAIIVHTDPLSYEGTKGTDSLEILNKAHAQFLLASSADVVFGVGPRLHNSMSRTLDQRAPSKSRKTVELTPGLSPFTECDEPANYTAVTFGRFDEKLWSLKQPHLAVAAVARVLERERRIFQPDPRMIVFGSPDVGGLNVGSHRH